MTEDSESSKDRIGVNVDTELKRQIRIEAARQDKTMSELVREILMEKFAEGNPNGATIAPTAD